MQQVSMAFFNLGLSALLFGVSLAHAQSAPERSIQVLGRSSATVTTTSIALQDVADITSSRIQDDEAVIALKKIVLERSPKPGRDVSLSASHVLERMRAAGVDLNRLSYTLPRSMQITRASRALSQDEVREVIENKIRLQNPDMELQSVTWPEEVRVSTGEVKLEAVPFATSSPARIGMSMRAMVDGQLEQQFNAYASVSSWKQIPVAKHPIAKGTLISEDDVIMARLNVQAIPNDAALDSQSVVGFEAHNDIGYGEAFRRNKIATPIVVQNGSKVTMRYRSDFLEATATGSALENGSVGQSIKVRNEASKKVLSGFVLETGLVEVRP